jgi:hypothetical protein
MTIAKKIALLLVLFLSVPLLYSQQKFALVIGNGNYTGISRLSNPVNDANDMEAALQELGFTVDKVLDGSLTEIENAVMILKNRLSMSSDSYGFLFYAGHGVQSNGVNYLIPVNANIPSENYLRERAVSVQAMMDELNDAGNTLNIVVLDACRDNPFGWARSGSRGLTVLSNQPTNSIIVYATSAGATAADGTGRNGLFTEHLLTNLKTPGLEVSEVFRLTGAAVSQASGRQQIPAIYNQFYGTAYFGSRPAPSPTPAPAAITPQPTPAPVVQWGPVINPNARWYSWGESGATARFNIARGFIEGRERDVLNIDLHYPVANAPNAFSHVAVIYSPVMNLLQAGSGLRFKVLGDGNTWRVILRTEDANKNMTGYYATITTRKDRIVEFEIPYTRFAYMYGRQVRFDKSRINQLAFERPGDDRTSSTLNIFDFEIIP